MIIIIRNIDVEGAVKENDKGGIGWNLSILGVDQDPYEFYLMFLSWEMDIKL